MLLGLYVKNFAIIDEISLDFKENLNILSGETGSGKSILIGSLNCALGGRISKELIRKDAEYAYVELQFESQNPKVEELLDRYELPKENGQLLVSRRIMQNGRSVLKVNGEPATQTIVKELAELLLDVHGQHEHQSLLYKKNHLDILDRFARKQEENLIPQLQSAYQKYMRCQKALQEETLDETERKRECALLEYECNEITSAQIVPGEKSELEAQYKRLSNQRQIVEAIDMAYGLTAGQEGAAESIQHAWKELERVASFDEQISSLLDTLSDVESLLGDLNREMSGYLSDMQENDNETLFNVSERLDLLHRLETKYGDTEEAILAYLSASEEKLQKYADYENYIASLQKQKDEAEKDLTECSAKLSRIREEAAKQLATLITDALRELNFLQVEFSVSVTDRGHFTEIGRDEAEFLISLNPGAELAPLSQIASGGELSRIMLGIKSVLADKDAIETLIFDEIDSGISGRTAQKVAERLAVISKNHQVICITHLPQIAAMADSHYLIDKQTNGQNTTTKVQLLDEKTASDEIARMLGGVVITDSVLQSADEMRKLAENTKKILRKN